MATAFQFSWPPGEGDRCGVDTIGNRDLGSHDDDRFHSGLYWKNPMEKTQSFRQSVGFFGI